MVRPLRIEFLGALYQVMSRGNGRNRIVRDDADLPVGGLCVGAERSRINVTMRQPPGTESSRFVSTDYREVAGGILR